MTASIIALFTGSIAYGFQIVIGGSGEPVEGMLMDGVREFNVSVQQWFYDPAIVKVNPGDKVKFIVTNKDVYHGFAINHLLKK